MIRNYLSKITYEGIFYKNNKEIFRAIMFSGMSLVTKGQKNFNKYDNNLQ